MIPLIVLLSTFIISVFAVKLIRGESTFTFPARIAMSVMLLFTAIGHFIYTNGMAMMMPDFIPYKKEMVYFTGVIEIAAAIALHIFRLRVLTAWLLISFLLIILLANIKASIDHVDYQKATFDGNGLNYLWFRIPLQILFIAWTYLCAGKIIDAESFTSKVNK
ncbi:MAG: hypothetical protein Q8O62_03710 [Aequorivita sp.]|nr:hypothetical protein [Aequorivita sp.]